MTSVVLSRRERLRRAAPYALILVVAGFLMADAGRFDAAAAAGRLGPAAWPLMILGLLALLAGGKALGLAWGAVPPTPPAEIGDTEPAGPLQPARAWIALATFAAYCLLLDTFGFPLATALLLGGFLVIAGYRRPLAVPFVAVAGSLGLFILFRTVVYVSMPIGIAPFDGVALGILRLVGVG